MKGYISFILVFVSMLLAVSLILLLQASNSIDLSKAVSVERAYGVGMNVKEAVLESARQGAQGGFSAYDASHDVSFCKHCQDHFCIPPTPANPAPPNICDPVRCAGCFRESEARGAASAGAAQSLALLGTHSFDDDFDISLGASEAEADVFLLPDPLSRNGFAPDYLRFRNDFGIGADSPGFDIRLEATIPKEVVISCE